MIEKFNFKNAPVSIYEEFKAIIEPSDYANIAPMCPDDEGRLFDPGYIERVVKQQMPNDYISYYARQYFMGKYVMLPLVYHLGYPLVEQFYNAFKGNVDQHLRPGTMAFTAPIPAPDFYLSRLQKHYR